MSHLITTHQHTASMAGSLPIVEGMVLGGRYRVVQPLVTGAMGSIYKAEHIRLARPVAVKFMAPQLLSDPRNGERFEREAEIMSSLRHPNIVEILDFDRTDQGLPFLVLEFLEGQSLEQYLSSRVRSDQRETFSIVQQVGEALIAAHELGVVHRDLKPANVLVVDLNGAPFVKLLDFGISKRGAQEFAEQAHLTGEFEVMGTPAYMPPEQAAGNAVHVDHRGDQYSFAALVYELLTGAPPFQADNVMDLLRHVIASEAIAPSRMCSSIPQALDAPLLKALSKEPESRYPDIRAFLDALHAAVGRESVPMTLDREAFEFSALHETGAHNESEVVTTAASSPVPAVSRQPKHPQFSTKYSQVKTRPSKAPTPQATAPAPHRANRVSARGATLPSFTSAGVGADKTTLAKATLQPGEDAILDAWGERLNFDDDLEKARGECLLGNVTLALSYLQALLEHAEAQPGAESERAIRKSLQLLHLIVERRLGSTEGMLRRLIHPSDSKAFEGLSPADVYVLTRLDGPMSLGDLVDVSPLSEADTWCAIARLLTRGMLTRAQ